MRATLLVGVVAALAAFALGSYRDADDTVKKQGNSVELPEVPEFVAKLTGYDTLEAAGVAAIERAYKCSHVYECGGLIGRRDSDGKYVVGPVTSSYAGDHVALPDGTPEGVTFVATYHTHPCLPDSHFVTYFSDADAMEAIVQHKTAFMGELCSGDVHEFDPLTMKPDTDAIIDPPTVIYLTPGKIVGRIKVDGKSSEPNTGMI